MRKYITIGLGIIVLVAAYFAMVWMEILNKKPERAAKKIVNTIFIDTVQNQDIPIIINTNGTLFAKNKIEIYSEVQGVLQVTSKDFKPGNSYQKGEVILRINNEEYYATLQAQKSNLYNAITSIMPDIRLDFPLEYEKWENYITNFDFNKATPELPVINSDKEKFFISGRNIYTTYYNLKNMEVRLKKFIIRAPYTGILTEALVNPGTLVRQGQKLGEFINPSVYEMEVSINAKYMNLLQKGNTVKLHNLEKTKTWEGTIVRVNGKVDQATQTVKAYIQLAGEGLKEGIYLEADLVVKSEKDAYEMPRKLLVNNESIFVLKDSVLDLVHVDPVYFKDKSVIIKGLKNGTIVLSRSVPGAYAGMQVQVYQEKTTN
jgi:membrane fusion protein (multidrug efflux system)